MNKALQEKLLFITGGLVVIFGLVILQQNFPSSLDSSKFLAQVPGENTYEECISDPTKIIQNGDFEQLINGVLPLYDLSTTIYSSDEVCFFEGYPNYVFPDPTLESNVLSLRYIRHIFSGDPSFHLFNSHQSDGAIQYLGNVEQGNYEISFKARNSIANIGFMLGFPVPTENTIRLYIGLSDTPINRSDGPESWMPIENCDYNTSLLDTYIVQWTRNETFGDCVLSQFDSYTYIDITSQDYETYTTTLNISESGSKYLYLLPFGYDPLWSVPEWTFAKPYGNIYMDDISMTKAPFTCGITFQGEGELYYSNLDGEYIPHNGGSIDIESIGNTSPVNTNPESFYVYSPAPGYLDIKTPADVEYSTEDILDLFSFLGGEFVSISSFSGNNFWVEYECLTACSDLPADFNQDGIVDGQDVQTFTSFFGQSCSNLETCQFDLNGDEIITVQDMMILMNSIGQECALPISSYLSPNNEESSGDELYNISGAFVKPSKIPGLQKPYNYVVDTKILNTKQTALRIEQFFPSNMILRSLYSSTKNISLVSKEGIVKFFNLEKTASVKSYLYLEANPEICKIVSQNKKAYAELVSYGLCK